MLQVWVLERNGTYKLGLNTHGVLLAAVAKLPELQVLRIVAPDAGDTEMAAGRATTLAPALPGLGALSGLIAQRLTTLDIAVRVDASSAGPVECLALPSIKSLKVCRLQLVAGGAGAHVSLEKGHSNLRCLSIRGVGNATVWRLTGLGDLPHLKRLCLRGLRVSDPGKVFRELVSSQLHSLNLDWNNALELDDSAFSHLLRVKSLRVLSLRKQRQPAQYGADLASTGHWLAISVRNMLKLAAVAPHLRINV